MCFYFIIYIYIHNIYYEFSMLAEQFEGKNSDQMVKDVKHFQTHVFFS
jgi:hypothetical protein